MRQIAIIKDSDFNLTDKNPDDFELRRAVRAVVIDNNGRVLMIHVTKYDYYKCPGGGVQGDEDFREALAREMMEEAGCKGKIIDEIGQIKELRSEYSLEQISRLYLVKMAEIGSNNLEKDEEEDGFKVVWFDNIDDAISILEQVKQTRYDEMFMAKRELMTLQAAKEIASRGDSF